MYYQCSVIFEPFSDNFSGVVWPYAGGEVQVCMSMQFGVLGPVCPLVGVLGGWGVGVHFR